MTAILLKGASIVYDTYTGKQLCNLNVYIEDGLIQEITEKSTGFKSDYVVECNKKAVLPGLANTHTHLAMTLFRGLADDLPLREWLEKRIWPLERKLKREHALVASKLGLIELVKAGVTAFADNYFFEDALVEATKSVGLRALVCPPIFDGEFEEHTLSHVSNLVLSQRCDALVKWGFGPHSIYSCKKETLEQIGALSKEHEIRVTIHLAETRWSQVLCEKSFGKRETDLLEECGLLSSRTLASHAVWVTKQEIRKLANYEVSVSFCPVSNMKLAEGGVAPVPELLKEGVRVSFGTDGAASNNSLSVLETIKIGLLLIKHSRWDPTLLKPHEALLIATKNGYEALGFPKHALQTGNAADVITLDLRTPSVICHRSVPLPNRIVYAPVATVDVIVSGKPVMINGKILTIDEEEAKQEFTKALEDF
ncbi:hypothetical protein B9Q01_01970 [Candidatus Marsarchaeota G1 archaeon OSP_D]|jgi:Cytosine deaminase and related metal-dependent hydrolases|uniref:Amidohydrolase-related domain-containing protein n=2 Tax=Candidatus Marsarchaeota group 1 TaxID=2203770 RepID=A0A2R6AD02_9ARCH|nr:MAG: hypothetical protein B9Q01_01970 [Candidatus Marsarchaeota G1 archaeon OSP_D]PSN89226.1 MAG: hypothetical protein B9Q00_02435 [Candidatus Marsarchaeota G1 archaeon OSP_C]